MAWTDLPLAVTGEVITSTWGNQVRADFAMLKLHSHSGADGDGGVQVGPLQRADYTDAAAPGAPGAGKTRLYTVGGRLRTRAGVAGADSQLVSSLDFTTQGDTGYYNGTSFVRLAPGTAGQFLRTAGAGANPTWANLTGLLTLAESVAVAPVASFSLTSIPGTHRGLMLVGRVRADVAQGASRIGLRMNGQTANHHFTKLAVTGTTATVTTTASQSSVEIGTYEEVLWTTFVVYLIGYALASEPMVQSSSFTLATAMAMNEYVGYLNVTGAVTQLDILATQEAFDEESFVTLYGLPSV